MIIWHMCNVCWIPEPADTNTQYVILIASHDKMLKQMRLIFTFIRSLPVLCMFHKHGNH